MALVERRQIAADLHDGVVQELTGLTLDLEAPADRPAGMSAAERQERTALANRLRAAVAQLRGQTAELYPPAASRIDVADSLRAMVDRVQPAVDARLDIAAGVNVAPAYRWLVFRVAQEALRNAAQHSRADHVVVDLRPMASGTVLTVSDDGVGFAPEVDSVEPGHMGLSLLSDMATAAGAALSIRSAPGRGTTVRLEIPE